MRYSSVLLSLLSVAWCVHGERVDSGYIVELSRSPAESSFFQHAIRQVRYTYDSDLLYGASVEFTDSASAKVALAHPDVVNIWTISHHTRPTALFDARQESSADQAISLQPYSPEQIPALTESYNEANHQLGVNGSNIRIGIIDSGVDYRHPALGGCFGSGCKIEFGHDLVGDDYDGTLASIHEDNDPLDNCPPTSIGATGHGTFVAGLIGATDSRFNWTGTAPAAKLGMWRVFGCKSQIATTDIFIKAMEMAYEAKMDVINLSFGQDGGWHEDIVSVVADRLVSRGVHVVVASGNIGTSGVMLTAAPATANGVVAVGSSMNTLLPGYILAVYDKNDNDTKSNVINIPYRTIVNKALALNISLPLVTSLDNACKDFDGKNYNGSITLIHHDSTCDLTTKLDNAYKAGVAIALVYTDTTETVQPITSIQNTAKLPSAFINSVAAEAIRKLTNSAKHPHVKGQFTNALVALSAPKRFANSIAGFSSLGPTNELALKPEIVATGGDVFSTMPLYRGGYGILSGTSMSAPLVTGAIALFLDAAKESVEPEAAKGALMNFARPVGSPIAKFPQYGDSPIRQGAGLLSVTRAIQGFKEFSVSPYKLSFNDTEHFEQTQTITITNRGDKDLSFNLVHGSALTVTGYDTKNMSNNVPLEPISFAVQDNSVSSVSFDKKTIEVAAGKSLDVQVTVTPPSSFHPDSHAIYGGYLGIETSDKSLSASVPYIGMIGNMSSLPILDRSSDGDYPFPSIGNYDGSIIRNNKTAEFSRQRRPTILVRLLTGTPLLELQVIQDEKVIGTVPFDEQSQFNRAWLPRNTRTTTSSSMTFRAYEWDGQYQTSAAIFDQPTYVKSGTYRIRVRALHVFGDRKNADDWDEWLSPPLNMNMDGDSSLASITSTPAATTSFANHPSATHFTETTPTPFADEEAPVPSGTEGFTMSISS